MQVQGLAFGPTAHMKKAGHGCVSCNPVLLGQKVRQWGFLAVSLVLNSVTDPVSDKMIERDIQHCPLASMYTQVQVNCSTEEMCTYTTHTKK